MLNVVVSQAAGGRGLIAAFSAGMPDIPAIGCNIITSHGHKAADHITDGVVWTWPIWACPKGKETWRDNRIGFWGSSDVLNARFDSHCFWIAGSMT